MDDWTGPQEEWCPIEGFPDYIVSNYGYVKNALTDRMMSRSPVQYGMLTIAMMYDSKQYRRSVATLVAQHFLPKPEREDFNTPIHLDGDRANCRVDNLVWRPRWFAINYHLEFKHPPFPRWNQDIILEQTGEVFETLREPASKYGLLEREIHKALVNGGRCFPHGYTFLYMND